MKAGVVGAGLMGAEIALVFALGGHEVLLHDRSDDALAAAMERLRGILDKGIARQFYAPEAAEAALARVQPVSALAAMAECALVTEAVYESIDAKGAVLRALDRVCQPACILASNTSTLPISTLAAPLRPERRARFLGTHYFSPVSRMTLVEVIPGFATDHAVVDEMIGVLGGIGKQPVRIKDVAGFAVNRMLHALLIEAVKLVEEGVATPADLDVACRLGLGHPIGPFAMMDIVTSDLCLQVQDILHDAYGERFRPPALLKQRVAAGLGGGKGRAGWIETNRDG
ncbi:3-hydroxyacyl-CoA dehydrogenase family protein [Sphingomonas hengshuiensis]|uniref:3-hydroxyacyl-CoA dehydrogenase n=1 Tax=Sphingomonas hengshuiensis TaxID=1609977 RepID=A0A7U4J6Z9_9SPHN|nr:3-hydroxyacyl-CoA dehydrogenase family protein [Sphingomonas hengshuiensis]AJP71287.1 3-hydroxyacyl-CoA dehydrogenase [Sphingomonas hengshuiensis]